MVEVVDTFDLKSNLPNGECGFESRSGYYTTKVVFFDVMEMTYVINSLMTPLRQKKGNQYGDVAQLVRASSLYLEGRRFNSYRPY